MKKSFKLLKIVFGFIVLIYCFYIYKLRSLAIEGNRIFELRCTTVNPPLIAYKNAFLKQAEIINSRDTSESAINDYVSYYGDYISNIRKYVVEEKKWLEIQSDYGDRWDFKLFEPWYLKDAWVYQLLMYTAYLDDAQGILDIGDGKIPADGVLPDYSKNRKLLNDAKKKYFDFFNEASAISDWRKMFSYVPTSDKCTEQNMTIPETGGSINWEGTPTPPIQIPHELESISG